MADIRQAQVELGGRGEQRLLVAEVAHHHRRVDAAAAAIARIVAAWYRWRRTARGRPPGSPPWWHRIGAAPAVWTHESIVCQHC
jgi:hypothetical protein